MMRAVLKYSLKFGLGVCVLLVAPIGPLAAQTLPAPAALPSARPEVSMPSVAPPVGAQPEAPMSAPIQARWDHIAGELRCLCLLYTSDAADE